MELNLSVKFDKDAKEGSAITEKMIMTGHYGTHCDIIDKSFPHEYMRRDAIVFDIGHIERRDVEISDIRADLIKKDMFVAFHTGFIEKNKYGSVEYAGIHPQLSVQLISLLIESRVSLIGIDFPGVRFGPEHSVMDKLCAGSDVFIIENLCNLGKLLDGKSMARFTAETIPLGKEGLTGLPCKVVAII